MPTQESAEPVCQHAHSQDVQLLLLLCGASACADLLKHTTTSRQHVSNNKAVPEKRSDAGWALPSGVKLAQDAPHPLRHIWEGLAEDSPACTCGKAQLERQPWTPRQHAVQADKATAHAVSQPQSSPMTVPQTTPAAAGLCCNSTSTSFLLHVLSSTAPPLRHSILWPGTDPVAMHVHGSYSATCSRSEDASRPYAALKCSQSSL